MHKGTLWLWAFLWFEAGCSTSSEYACPDPIGKIIRDDCEVYRVKYESLKVELGANLGPLEAKAALGQKSLRDPSELLQLMAHRTLSLCKDFNACRVLPLEYRQRREETDRIFTSVSTIQGQLKGDLDAESKAKLAHELVRILSEDRGSARTKEGSSVAARSLAPRTKRRSFSSWIPWFDTRILPPQPGALTGFPQVGAYDFHLEHVFRQQSPYGIIGYRPILGLYLRGKVESDDVVTVDWGGQASDCPVGQGESNGLVSVHCKAPEKVLLTGNTSVKIMFRRGLDGKSALIDQHIFSVVSREVDDTKNGSRHYAENHDPLLKQGRLVFQPYPDWLPAEFEQPALEVVLKMRKYRPATARCWVNGQAATPGIASAGGEVGSFQDRPRYEETGPGSSRAVAEPFVYWHRKVFPLPFLVQRERNVLPVKFKAWPLAGSWRCVISVEGEPVRELSFNVNGDGRLRPHPKQTERPSAAWLVETKLLQNPFEVFTP